jgi:hypothetical protein
MTNDYSERPDILILPGHPTEGFPSFSEERQYLKFSFDLEDGTVVLGTLKVINSSTIPCRSRSPRGGMLLPITGIIECSVNKTEFIASEQLTRYEEVFHTSNGEPPLFLITGNDLSLLHWENALVDLSTDDINILESEATKGVSLAMDVFGIL